jgi:hypothetical protein
VNILECSQKSIQILFTRSKVSSRRFYESFTSKKQCKSYVRDIRPSRDSSRQGYVWDRQPGLGLEEAKFAF